MSIRRKYKLTTCLLFASLLSTNVTALEHSLTDKPELFIDLILDDAKIELAKKTLKDAKKKNLPKSQTVALVGQILLSKQQYQPLLNEVKEIEDINVPLATRVNVLMLRADAYMALGHKDESKLMLLKALMLDRENEMVQSALNKISLIESREKALIKP